MKQDTKKRISFIIPVYNEETNILLLYNELISVLSELPYDREFIFVDDGSTDKSLAVIKHLAEKDEAVFYLELSRNFGHQYALKAGLDISSGDAAVSMDCDLQHPPEVVKQLIAKWEEGFDVVYTKRLEDSRLPWFKRKTSAYFYSLLDKISDLKLEAGTADFRLMNRTVLNAFSHLNESELFIRGLIKWAGFRQTAIDYHPRERHSGESKYNFRKMMSFALQAGTSFSVKPLRLIVYLGMVLFLISMILIPYALVSYFMYKTVSGWTSLMISIIFFGSLQLLMIGIIGIYISKLVVQSKHRPLYFIRETNYNRALQRNNQNGS
jgi:polyisoprenyl-phosphate glycosyltransferase